MEEDNIPKDEGTVDILIQDNLSNYVFGKVPVYMEVV